MNHAELANKVLDSLREPPTEIPPIENEEARRNNAARCMVHFFCNRLSSNGEAPHRIKHTTFQWMDGLVALRNARIIDHHWTSLPVTVVEQLHHEAETKPVWSDPVAGNMQRVIRRLGFVEPDRIEHIASEMYSHLRWEDANAVLQYVAVGTRIELNSVIIQFSISSPSSDRGNNGKSRSSRPEER